MTEHDKIQDVRLDGLETAIRQQTKILADLRKFHMPWIDSEWQTKLRMKVVLPIVKFGAVLSVATALIKGVSWYITDMKVEEMANRYQQVAMRLFFEEHDSAVAIEFMDKAVALREKNTDYRFRRAFLAGTAIVRELAAVSRPLTREESDKAHRVLAEAVFLKSQEPTRFEPYLLEAQVQTALKNYDKAFAAFAKARELAGENLIVLLNYAECAFRAKKYELTDELLTAAETLRPDSRWVLLQRGEYEHVVHRDAAKARACYEKFIAADPSSARAWHDLGWTWIAPDSRDCAKAREAMRRALALQPNYKEAYFAMGMFYQFEGNMSAARTWFDGAVALDANYLEAIKWRGIVSGELEDWSASADDFAAALRLDPMNADLYARRAKVLRKKGDLVGARVEIDFALELAPENPRYMKLRDEFAAGEEK